MTLLTLTQQMQIDRCKTLNPHKLKFVYKISLTAMLLCSYQYIFPMYKDSTQIISVDADIISVDEAVGLKFPDAKADEYFMVITLTNTQDTAVRIRIMTCGWSESFTFDKDSLYLTYPGCDSNFPTTIKISAHKTVKFYSKLRCYKKNNDYTNPLSFKIGFVDLPYKYFWGNPNSRADKKKYKTYWSDNIYLRSRLYQYKEENAGKDN